MSEVREKCGVAAVNINTGSRDEGKVGPILYRMLLNLQNRGQLSAGITTYNDKRDQLIDTYKNVGTVNEVFKTSIPILAAKIFSKYSGNMGIGHVRYATCGKDSKSYAQPFERHHGRKWKWFSFCFNGNIANYSVLAKHLMEKTQYHLVQQVDTEIIMHYISRQLGNRAKPPELAGVFSNLSEVFDGSYSLTFLNANGEMVALRDPLGIRPLCYGWKDDVFMVASESNALSNSGVEKIKDVKPGEMIYINGNQPKFQKFAECKKKSHCMFEYVYFANVASNQDGSSVYISRSNLGKELSKIETEKIGPEHVVIPVPDSAKPAGDAMAYELGLPSREGLIRNRFVGRTFIESGNRQDKVRNKFTVLREIVDGKKVILVDDSIVRGTTTKNIVTYLKDVGHAKEVHLRISCPPILCPCFYGIDMSTVGELFARKFTNDIGKDELPAEVLDKMAKDLKADSLIYQTIPGLVKAIGMDKKDLCMACLNGEYPTPWGKKLYEKAEKDKNVDLCSAKRTYEQF